MTQPMLFDDHGHAHWPAGAPQSKGGEFAPKPGSASWIEQVSARLPGETKRSQQQYRILGINDEQTECDNCGKTNLKKTVVMALLDEDGNPDGETRCGVDCAAKLMRVSETKVRNEVATVTGRLNREVEHAREQLEFWERLLDDPIGLRATWRMRNRVAIERFGMDYDPVDKVREIVEDARRVIAEHARFGGR